MRPVLVSLGPWSTAVLPMIFIVMFALLVLWQWLEFKYAEGKKITPLSVAVAAAIAVPLTLLLFFGVNRVAPVEIKSWGTMLVVAFAAGTWYMARYGDKRVIEPGDSLDLALYILIGAVIGARLIFVALDWGAYAGHPAKLLNGRAGCPFTGAFWGPSSPA